MKAKDLEVGTEYAVCTVYPDGNQWQNVDKVKVIEAPVVGWARKYSYGHTYPVEGRVNTSPKARKDHALVLEYKRHWGTEGTYYTSESKTQRVPLRHIQMTWTEYEAKMAAKKERAARQKVHLEDLDASLKSISDRLPGNLHIERSYAGVHRPRPIVLSGWGNHYNLIEQLEALLNQAGL